jgi:hypothetical protein
VVADWVGRLICHTPFTWNLTLIEITSPITLGKLKLPLNAYHELKIIYSFINGRIKRGRQT